MTSDVAIRSRLRALFDSQRFAVLGTEDRGNKTTDTHESIAVTVLGRAFEADADDRDALARLFMARQPGLAGFAAAPGCAVVRVEVTAYLLVRHFQHTLEWRPDASGVPDQETFQIGRATDDRPGDA